MSEYLKVETFIPEENVWPLIEALNQAELLVDNGYDFVFSAAEVKGHFRPLEGARPYSGTVGEISEVNEIKLEFRIKMAQKDKCYQIMMAEHPYEVPVINFIKLV